MNKESYAALTPSQKAIFDKHTGKALSLKAAKVFDDWSAEAFKMASDSKKVEVIQLSSDGPQSACSTRRSPSSQKTLADLEKHGIKDARAVYEAINKCPPPAHLHLTVSEAPHARSMTRSSAPSRFIAAARCWPILMTVIIVDVTGRYVFNSPLNGSLDLSIVLLVLVRVLRHRLRRAHRGACDRRHGHHRGRPKIRADLRLSSSSRLLPASPRSGRGGCSSPDRPQAVWRKHPTSEHPVRADLQGARPPASASIGAYSSSNSSCWPARRSSPC